MFIRHYTVINKITCKFHLLCTVNVQEQDSVTTLNNVCGSMQPFLQYSVLGFDVTPLYSLYLGLDNEQRRFCWSLMHFTKEQQSAKG